MYITLTDELENLPELIFATKRSGFTLSNSSNASLSSAVRSCSMDSAMSYMTWEWSVCPPSRPGVTRL